MSDVRRFWRRTERHVCAPPYDRDDRPQIVSADGVRLANQRDFALTDLWRCRVGGCGRYWQVVADDTGRHVWARLKARGFKLCRLHNSHTVWVTWETGPRPSWDGDRAVQRDCSLMEMR